MSNYAPPFALSFHGFSWPRNRHGHDATSKAFCPRVRLPTTPSALLLLSSCDMFEITIRFGCLLLVFQHVTADQDWNYLQLRGLTARSFQARSAISSFRHARGKSRSEEESPHILAYPVSKRTRHTTSILFDIPIRPIIRSIIRPIPSSHPMRLCRMQLGEADSSSNGPKSLPKVLTN